MGRRWDGSACVVGHRGSPHEAIENTLPSFRAAFAAGADAVELDARLSADGEVVVHHDLALGRVIEGEGAVDAWSAATLAKKGVPRLADVFAEFPEGLFDVELKADQDDAQALSSKVADVVARADALDRVLVTSFDPMLAEAYTERTGRHAGLITPFPLAPSDLADWPRLTHVCLVRDAADPEIVDALRRSGRVVHVWTVNDPEEAQRMWRMGAAAVITDRPGPIARARPRAAAGP